MTIIYGDSTQLDIDFSEFDSQISDPPYSEHVHRNTTSQSVGGGVRHNDLGFAHLSPELRLTIANAVARVKRWSIVYSDIEGLHDWRDYVKIAGGTYVRALPWVRWSSPQLSGDRPPQGFELVTAYWGSQRGRKHWNGPGNLTHLAHKCMRGDGKHKTQKPLDQALDLVEFFTDPGDRVLDLCAGSGTVGLACKLLGRDFVGYEIDPEWAEKAANRIEAPLTGNDVERYDRYMAAKETRELERTRIRANTDKIRKKLDESKRETGEHLRGVGAVGDADHDRPQAVP